MTTVAASLRFRIEPFRRHGLEMHRATLFAADGRVLAQAEAWSVAGAFTALRKLVRERAKSQATTAAGVEGRAA